MTEPLSLALLRRPGDAGADIACGEGQRFGVAACASAARTLGFFACRDGIVRQMPGRLVGQTVDDARQAAASC